MPLPEKIYVMFDPEGRFVTAAPTKKALCDRLHCRRNISTSLTTKTFLKHAQKEGYKLREYWEARLHQDPEPASPWRKSSV